MNVPDHVDSYGDDCYFYDKDPKNICDYYGNCFDAVYGTPDIGCCACGGGITLLKVLSASPTEGSTGNCVDVPDYIDSIGDDCSFYDGNPESFRDTWGDCCDAGYGTPNIGCCAFGGGITLTDPPVSSPIVPSATPTERSNCSGITVKKTCNKTNGCGFNVFDNECRIAFTTSDGKKRKCKKNGCKYKKNPQTCVGRWDQVR